MSATGRYAYAVAAVVVAGCAVAAGALLVRETSLDVLAAFTTDMSARSPEQRHNIRRAAAALDGLWLRPGEEFSFNRAVGRCSAARGYTRAPAIIDGELRPEWGGGVCQVSSTLYNAALLAGLKITARVPHSRPVSSVPPGRDATAAYGIADLRFRNSTSSLLRITARANDHRLTVTILGRRKEPVEVEVYTRRVGQPGAFAALAPRGVGMGLDQRVQDSVVLTYRVIRRPSGDAVRELISRDVYASLRPQPQGKTR